MEFLLIYGMVTLIVVNCIAYLQAPFEQLIALEQFESDCAVLSSRRI